MDPAAYRGKTYTNFEVQTEALEQLVDWGRRYYRGSVNLRAKDDEFVFYVASL